MWEIYGGGGLSNSVPRLAPSITVVELGVIHLVHVASQIWYSNIRLALCDVATSYTNQMLAILLRYSHSKK